MATVKQLTLRIKFAKATVNSLTKKINITKGGIHFAPLGSRPALRFFPDNFLVWHGGDAYRLTQQPIK